MIVLKRPKEIEQMKTASRIVADLHDAIEAAVRPGISTWDLEMIAEGIIKETASKPAFKNYRVGRHVFPCCLCISVNEEVVHGIPSKDRILKNGDIVSVDFGTQKDGFFGDSAWTYPVGEIDEESKLLLKVTEEALYKGIEYMVPGNRLQDIGAAIQQHAEQYNFGIVRDFVGHGIGRKLHEDPQVPNYGTFGRGPRLKAGMVLAVEPMINLGTEEVEVLKDGWTVVTKDRKRSAHFEHTIAITKDGPLILTQRSGNIPAPL